MRVVCAEPTDENLGVVLGLVQDATGWLGTKDTDQWERPWPTPEARDARVFKGLQRGATWIVWDDNIPAATVTITPRKNPAVWATPECTCNLAERAVFVHRLITARKYAGRGLGAELIDWAGLRGHRLYGARWIRIDVWSTNQGLHEYYLKAGFERCGSCADPSYPSGALFQKPVSAIRKPLPAVHGVRRPARDRPLVRAKPPACLRMDVTALTRITPLTAITPRTSSVVPWGSSSVAARIGFSYLPAILFTGELTQRP